jgi:hypothetical protein
LDHDDADNHVHVETKSDVTFSSKAAAAAVVAVAVNLVMYLLFAHAIWFGLVPIDTPSTLESERRQKEQASQQWRYNEEEDEEPVERATTRT